MIRLLGRILITVTLAGAGFFFLANGFQSYRGQLPSYVLAQRCYPSLCIYPEWIAVGGCLLLAAFLFYRHSDKQ